MSTKPSTSCLNTYYKSLYVPIGVLLFYYNSVSQLCSIPKQNKKVLSAKNEGNSKLGNKTQKDKKYVSLISLFDRVKPDGMGPWYIKNLLVYVGSYVIFSANFDNFLSNRSKVFFVPYASNQSIPVNIDVIFKSNFIIICLPLPNYLYFKTFPTYVC